MDDLEKTITETLQRVNQFGIDNTGEISKFPKAVACFATIQTAVDGLESRGLLRASAVGSKFSASERRALKRHSFTGMVTRLAVTARDIARTDPTFVNKFRTPQRNKSDLAWLEAGRAFAVDSAAVKDKFEDYGYLPDFIDKLTAEADEFETAINAQNAATGQRIDSNASIDSMLDDSLKALRTLKIIVPNIFEGNPGKLADWASASHIEKKASKPEPPTAPVQ